MKTDKELADELDARDRLFARGYKQEQCPDCKGEGWIQPERRHNVDPCYSCGGRGWCWVAPPEKKVWSEL